MYNFGFILQPSIPFPQIEEASTSGTWHLKNHLHQIIFFLFSIHSIFFNIINILCIVGHLALFCLNKTIESQNTTGVSAVSALLLLCNTQKTYPQRRTGHIKQKEKQAIERGHWFCCKRCGLVVSLHCCLFLKSTSKTSIWFWSEFGLLLDFNAAPFHINHPYYIPTRTVSTIKRPTSTQTVYT